MALAYGIINEYKCVLTHLIKNARMILALAKSIVFNFQYTQINQGAIHHLF
jgi:hypothetical protein